MTAKELLKSLNYEPGKFEYTRKINYSSKMIPYEDNEHSFAGYVRVKSNVLAEKSDAAAKAMCKGAK